MVKRTLLIAASLLALGALVPVSPAQAEVTVNGQSITNKTVAEITAAQQAQASGQTTGKTTATTSGKTSSSSTLSRSDENFLSEMPMEAFPGASELKDENKNGIVDSEETGSLADPFAAQNAKDKETTVKYIYKGESTMTMRRMIEDERIDDGYVQSLMKQHGPK